MSYRLTEEILEKYKDKNIPWGFNGLGAIVYYRTYSRKKSDNTYESWPETILRCINGAQDIGAHYSATEAKTLFDYMFNLKCTFAGRMLWQLGTDNIHRYGGNSLLNCWAIAITNLDAFCFLFENLMLGGGVGFSVRREDIHELPKVKKDVTILHCNTKDADFIIPDSRLGWVSILKKILKSYFITGKSFSYSTILVRGYGEPIKGFGGTASGPGILVEGLTNICNVFKTREGKKLRSIDVLDICNIIGSIVVAGNLRRSAELALGDPDDYLYLRAKRWDLGDIPNYRSLSNNSLYIDDFSHITNDVWDGYSGSGEPYGFFNINLAQKFGRIGEPKKDKCELINPCGEITLESYECCNLSDIYLQNITSKAELFDCAKLLYKTQKAICALPFLHEQTEKIVHKNFRIGIGMTGICQSMDKLDWLDDCYCDLISFDKEWSKKQNYPESIRISTLKPSGSVSLLAGSTPGVHPAYSKHYIRRIRMASDDKLVAICKEAGYVIDYVLNFDGSKDYKTVVIDFPCCAGENTITTKDMTAIAQLELVKKLMHIWADNSISVSVYYKKEELLDIKEWLKKNYKDNIKSISFILHKDHGFEQSPYVEITEEQYKEMIAKIKPISQNLLMGSKELDVEECKGACPIK